LGREEYGMLSVEIEVKGGDVHGEGQGYGKLKGCRDVR
jgi:hypothetical protein